MTRPWTLATPMIVLLAGLLFAEEPAENTPLSNAKAVAYAPGVGRTEEAPIPLKPGPHLFIDDYLIASSENIERIVVVPSRDLPEPVVTGEEDGCFQPYMTVLRDPATGRFKIWYGHRTDDFNSGRSHIGYLESGDGIHWERPARILTDPAPIQFGVSVIDEGPAFPTPAQRYKYGWYFDGGLQLAVSPDGFDWTAITSTPVLRHNHDITGIFFDSLRKRYVATLSVYRTGDDWSGNRRITMQSYSADFAQWTAPHYVVLPKDGPDPGETQFYAMDGYLVRGELMLGMVKVLHDEVKVDNPPNPPDAYGMGLTELAWSRDGETWVRDRTPFFNPNPQPGTWDHAHAWIDEQVVVGDEVYLYYGGYARGHKVERFKERQIGLVRIGLDRYVARACIEKPGKLITPPLVLEGVSLTINAAANNGEIRLQVLDANGKPIAGYAKEDCAPIRDDAVAIPVSWKRSLAEVNGQTLQLEFFMDHASLYGFELLSNK